MTSIINGKGSWGGLVCEGNQEDTLLISTWTKVILATTWTKIAVHLTYIPLADTHVPQRGAGNGGQAMGKL